MSGRFASNAILANRNLRLLLAEGFLALFFYTGCSALGGSFLLAFLKSLGASPFAIGILGAIPSLGLVAQVFASYALEKGASTRAVCFWGNFLGKAALAGVVVVPMLGGPGHLTVLGMLAFALVATLLWAYGTNAYVSWNVDLIPFALRGRFAAMKNLVCQVVAVLVLLGAGKLLTSYPGRAAYLWVFAIGTFFGVASTLPFLLLPDGPRARSSALGFAEVVRAPLRDRNFRAFLGYLALFAFANSLIGPFSVSYMLDDLRASIFFIAGMDSTSIGVTVVFAFFWGGLSDRVGHARVLKTCSWALCLMPIVWLGCRPATYRFVVPLLYGTAAIFWAGLGLAQYNLMLELAPPSGNAKYFSVAAIAAGLTGMVGSVLAGWFVKNAAAVPLIGTPARAFFALCLTTVTFRLLGSGLLTQVKGARERPQPAPFAIVEKVKPAA
jgi:hypothetical protein